VTKTYSISKQARSFCFFALMIWAAHFGVKADAQTTTGTIYGTVADANGAVIANASVVATEVATGLSHTVTSNSSGNYVFPALNPNTYTVSTAVPGFQSIIQRGVVLSANQNVHANFALVIGSVDQTVSISAGTTLVDTRDSQLAETVDRQRIADLPLNGRNVYDLVQIMPGVTDYSADSVIGSRAGSTFSVNDLPVDSVSYYLDGAPDNAEYQNGGNLLPNPDALQEFRLLTSNFDAEFGRSPGGAVNVITRSGTKNFHGMAYEYLRNNIFNSKNYFDSGPATSLKQNQFGGTVGGPLLPNGRAFFFASYERLQIHTPAVIGPTQIITATALERKGDFSQSANKPTLAAGTNCGTKAAPVICPAALDPVAQNLLAFVPVETAVGGSPAFTTQQEANADTTANQGLARVDFRLTPAHQIEAMFFNSHGSQANPNDDTDQIMSYAGMDNYENQLNATVADTWTISPRTLNNLRGFYTQSHYIISNIYSDHLLPNLGSQAPEGGPISAPPEFAITGYWTMGTKSDGPSDITQMNFGLVDTANLTRGHHEIKLGGSYVWLHYQETGGVDTNGIFKFTGGVTGNALADFLEGKANSLLQTTETVHRTHNFEPSLFVQDNWQATQRLSLNLGLRWEVYGPYVGDQTSGTFIPNQQSTVLPAAPLGLLVQGDRGVPQGVFNTAYNKFAPRLGFAYDVFGNGRTSLRGAFGIFYEQLRESYVGDLQQQPYGLSVTTNKLSNLVNPYSVTGADPFPFVFNPSAPVFVSGATVKALPANGGSTPYVEEYHLTVEQQFGKQWALRVGYVGNAGRKIFLLHDINAPIYAPNATTTTANINARRPYEPSPSTFVFGTINSNDNVNNFGYNSLQTTLRGSIGSRFSVLANYVWSKGISYEGPVVNGLDIGLDRGLGSSDIRNNFSASFLYRLPNVKALGVFGTQVLSGWQINGITLLHSGVPFTVISGVDTAFTGTVNERANIVGNPYNINAHTRTQKIQQYLNPGGFSIPTGPYTTPEGPYGNEQNNSIIGPGFVNTDLSVFKIFPLYRDIRLQFRAEAFNAFNNVNLGTPVSNLTTLNSDLATATSVATPQITSLAGKPRVVQFAMKLLF
jgi:hypothetical protein